MRLVKNVSDMLLSNFIGYYDGSLKTFALNNSAPVFKDLLANNNKQYPIVILSRNFYSESQRFYPVASEKELRKVIAFELNEHEFYLPSFDADKHGYNVTVWKINVPADHTAQYFIPESLLLAQVIQPQELYCVGAHPAQYYLGKQNLQFYSAIKTRLLATPELFANASGLVFEKERHIDKDLLARYLIEGLKKCSFNWLIYLKSPVKSAPVNVKPLALSAVVAILLYLGVSSAYLFHQQGSINDELAQIGGRVNAILAKDADLKKMADTVQEKHAIIAQTQLSAYLWQVLGGVYQTENRITQVRLLNNRYVIHGEGPKATEVLSILADTPRVINAKFDANVTKRRGKERFVISFAIDTDKEKV